MISIIIASTDSAMLQQVRSSIDQTIGLPYEILTFENSNGSKGICEIYNEGITNAAYDILCFMHEDIVFKTNNWGNIVLETFNQNPQLGAIGIAGTTYQSAIPTGWYSIGLLESQRFNLLQSFKYDAKETIHAYSNPKGEKLAEVVTLDGVWMCVKKEVTEKFVFDSDTFKKFHCYDLDFCLSVGKLYNMAVVYNVQLQHLSEGNFDRQWMKQTLLFNKKWIKELPKTTQPLTKKQIRKIEEKNFFNWLKQMHQFGFEEKIVHRLLNNPRLFKIFGFKKTIKFHYRVFAFYHVKRSQKKAV